MKQSIIKVNAFAKGLVLAMKPHLFMGWLRHPLATTANTLSLAKWIAAQDKKSILNDFYTPKREYAKRQQLYTYIIEKLNLNAEPIDYLEFGVSGAGSFKWWLHHIDNQNSRFYGFDTFEGLPEDWGTFRKGDMSANIPVVNDSRAHFLKGLFQDTLPDFIVNNDLNSGKRKVVHLDADLFSSTLYTLTSLAPYLKKGDILMFDEFNVPNHEFLAFKIFTESFYVKTRLLGAVNNYYQIALIIE
ncbi:macrocin O-methyltransferase [Taibaiella sp. KBW10]|uniref:TylF/MycF/NovP-related O-methyltransferase n=1 Tax=Taibaiella sp. KBW10 TaxID=2153357 RepID=UPI000F5B395B|nr:TylF/MycF/NovP-related O-methyltransferase [Taibaiella sp. KBW10]RQO32220.1 macrocin O-methyltransferase [Taibaiella sp. KBW10]